MHPVARHQVTPPTLVPSRRSSRHWPVEPFPQSHGRILVLGFHRNLQGFWRWCPDLRNTKRWIGLSGMHDAPRSATLSVTDGCPWWDGDRASIRSGFQTCRSILLAFEKSGPSRLGRSGGSSGWLGKTRAALKPPFWLPVV